MGDLGDPTRTTPYSLRCKLRKVHFTGFFGKVGGVGVVCERLSEGLRHSSGHTTSLPHLSPGRT